MGCPSEGCLGSRIDYHNSINLHQRNFFIKCSRCAFLFNARDLGESVSVNGVARSENCLGGGKINYFSFALPARNFANFILLLASPPPCP